MQRKGTYILVAKLDFDSQIVIGKLDGILFNKGFYAYIGSAQNSLDPRLMRHFGRTKKKIHWHIDYFLERATPVKAYINEGPDVECKVAARFAETYGIAVEGFGSSDCRCHGHLFYLGRRIPPELKSQFQVIDGYRFDLWVCPEQ